MSSTKKAVQDPEVSTSTKPPLITKKHLQISGLLLAGVLLAGAGAYSYISYTTSTGLFSRKAQAHYVGETQNGVPHGAGTQVYVDGSSYSGAFVNGKRTGAGTYKLANGTIQVGQFLDNTFGANHPGTIDFPDGSYFKGTFENGVLNGEGIKYYISGIKYRGYFKDGMLNGLGSIRWPNGKVYEGLFKNDLFNGQGTLTEYDEVSEKIITSGEFVDGTLNGDGQQIHTKQYTYTGQFKGSIFNGDGILEYSNGTLQRGFFQNGLPNGISTYEVPGEWSYTGEYLNGQPSSALGTVTRTNDEFVVTCDGTLLGTAITFPDEGQGSITWNSGRSFSGNLQNCKKIINGTMTYSDELSYSGTFKDGFPMSSGVFTYKDGTVYNGETRNHLPDGRGVFKYPTGDVYSGGVKQGFPYGDGRKVFADGRQLVGSFSGTDAVRAAQITYPTNRVIVAEFSDMEGAAFGRVVAKEPNGDFYIGAYKDNKPIASGFMKRSFSNATYQGTSFNGVPHGTGRIQSSPTTFQELRFNNGKPASSPQTWTLLGKDDESLHYFSRNTSKPSQVTRLTQPLKTSPIKQLQAEVLANYDLNCTKKTLTLKATKLRTQNKWIVYPAKPVLFTTAKSPTLRALGTKACQ